jgi:hypothetical protein
MDSSAFPESGRKDRLARKAELARQSRQKKKQYVRNLEVRLEQLQSRLYDASSPSLDESCGDLNVSSVSNSNSSESTPVISLTPTVNSESSASVVVAPVTTDERSQRIGDPSPIAPPPMDTTTSVQIPTDVGRSFPSSTPLSESSHVAAFPVSVDQSSDFPFVPPTPHLAKSHNLSSTLIDVPPFSSTDVECHETRPFSGSTSFPPMASLAPFHSHRPTSSDIMNGFRPPRPLSTFEPVPNFMDFMNSCKSSYETLITSVNATLLAQLRRTQVQNEKEMDALRRFVLVHLLLIVLTDLCNFITTSTVTPLTLSPPTTLTVTAFIATTSTVTTLTVTTLTVAAFIVTALTVTTLAVTILTVTTDSVTSQSSGDS